MGTTETATPFQALLQRAVDVAGQKQEAAKAIGITPSRFSRLFHAAPGSYTLNAQNCFRLARLIGEPPQTVLRLVGKTDLADAIEEHYGRSRIRVAAQPPVDPLALAFQEALAAGADRRLAQSLAGYLRATVAETGAQRKPPRKSARSA